MCIGKKPSEVPLTPHPEPYCKDVIDLEELKKFIQSSINLNKQSIIIFGANWCPDARCVGKAQQAEWQAEGQQS